MVALSLVFFSIFLVYDAIKNEFEKLNWKRKEREN